MIEPRALCPACRKKATVEQWVEPTGKVVCVVLCQHQDCDASICTETYDTKEEACARWDAMFGTQPTQVVSVQDYFDLYVKHQKLWGDYMTILNALRAANEGVQQIKEMQLASNKRNLEALKQLRDIVGKRQNEKETKLNEG